MSPEIRTRNREYRQALAADDFKTAIRAAKEAWTRTETRYGAQDLRTLYALAQVGEAHSAYTDYCQARDYYLEAMYRRKQQFGKDVLVAHFLLEAGVQYCRIGQNNDALIYYAEVLDVLDHLESAPDSLYAKTYLLAAISASHRKEFAKAESYFAQAEKAFLRAWTPDQLPWADYFAGLGKLRLYQGRFAEAEEALQTATKIRDRHWGAGHPHNAEVREDLARMIAAKMEGRDTDAYRKQLEYNLKCLFPDWSPGMRFSPEGIRRRRGDPRFQRLALQDYGEWQYRNAQTKPEESAAQQAALEHAFSAFYTAFCADRKRNASYRNPTSKLVYHFQLRGRYERYLDIIHQLYALTGDPKWAEKLLEWLEDTLHAIGRGTMQARTGMEVTGVSPKTINRVDAREKVTLKIGLDHRQRYNASNWDAYTMNSREGARMSIYNECLYDSIWQAFPEYDAYMSGPIRATLADIRRMLPEDGAFLYHLGFGKLHMVGISKDTIVMRAISEPRPMLDKYWQLALVMNKDSAAMPSPQGLKHYQELAFGLQEVLIAPLLEGIKRPVKRLIFSGNGHLLSGVFPFEALLTDTLPGATSYAQLPYLFRTYSVQYALSASSWKIRRMDKKRTHSGKILAFAPDFEGNTQLSDQRIPLRRLRGVAMEELPGAAREIGTLSRYFEGDYYTGDAATKENFTRLAEKAGLLHVASHGVGENDWDSRVVFAQGKDRGRESEFRSSEAEHLRYKADLVVLSACETSLGQYTIEAVQSLARAFEIGGCAASLGAVWPVDDYATEELMRHFYAALADGLPKDVALQRAKQAYLEGKDGIASHPYFWAAFIGSGDPRPISLKKVETGGGIAVWLTLAGGALLILAIFWWRRRRKNPAI